MAGEVYNQKGIIKGINLDQNNGLPEGFSLQRTKNGEPTGDVRFYAFTDLGEHAESIRESIKTLQKDQVVDYQTINYVPIKIGAKGTVYSGGNGKKFYDPEAEKRRQILIARQSCLERSVELWLGVKPDNATLNQESLNSILSVAKEFEMWVMR
jgi:hypothetical protein